MSCGYSEERLALWMDSSEADLSTAEIQERDRHLASCAGCREVLTKLRESQLFVRSLRADSVNSAVVTQVHARVMDRVAELKRPPAWVIQVERSLLFGMRWKYALAGFGSFLLVGCLALGLFWKVQMHEQNSVQVPPVPAPIAAEAYAPVALNSPAGNAQKVAPVGRKKHSPKQETVSVAAAIPAANSPKVMVTLFTDDPSVVIYWSLD